MSVLNWDFENFKPLLAQRLPDGLENMFTERKVGFTPKGLSIIYRVKNQVYEEVYNKVNDNYELDYWAHWIESELDSKIDFMAHYVYGGRNVDFRNREITAMELKDGVLFLETTITDYFGNKIIEHTKHTDFVSGKLR